MKTLSLFKLTDEQQTLNTLTEDLLTQYKFTPCGKHDALRMGFTENIVDGMFVSDVMGYVVVTVKEQTKKPKKYSVDQLVEEKSANHENLFGKSPTKGEVKSFAIEAREELLPNTEPDEPKVYTVAFRKKDGLVLVEANYKKAESLLALLRKTLGSLPVIPLETDTPVTDFMDEAVGKSLSDTLTLGSKGKFVGEDMVHSLSKGSLYDDHAKDLIKDGFLAEDIQMEYEGIITFSLKADLLLDGLKFDKELFATEDGESDEAGNFVLKLTEVNKLVDDLLSRLEG